MNHTGGTFTTDGDMTVGVGVGTGTYNLSGTAVLNTGITYLGAPNSTFDQNGGDHNTDYLNVYGGQYNLQSGTIDVAANMGVGYLHNSASFTQTGGAVTVNDADFGLSVGGETANATTGTYTLNSGTLTVAASTRVGSLGVGTFNQNGGTHTVTSSVNVAGVFGSTGTYNLAGGALTAANMNVNAGGTFNWSGGTLALGTAGGGTLTNAGQVNVGGGVSGTPVTHTLNATVTNTGRIEVAADTTLSSAGQIINTGNFNVKASAKLDGGGSFTQSAGLLTANGVLAQAAFDLDGGTLNGTGTINGNVIVDGALVAPGQSPGTLTVNGDFTLNSGTLEIEIGGTGPGEYDVLNITGAADFNGGTILFAFINGFLPTKDNAWTFLTYTSLLSFIPTSVQYTGLASGFSYSLDTVGGSFVMTALNDGQADVPEPGTWLLLGAGLLGWRRVRVRLALAA